MSTEDRTANVLLTADVRDYSSQMTAAAQQTNAVTASLNTLLDTLDKATKTTGKGLTIVSAGMLAGITAATVAAGRFEQQLSSLEARAATANQAFAPIKASVDAIRRDLPVATEQVVALSNALTKMGTNPSQLRQVADTLIKLGGATGEDLGGLATSMVALQRAMGTNQTGIKQYADLLVNLSAKMGTSATSVLQFSESIAPIGRTLQMTQQEVMGFSAAFSKAGQDGFMASNVFTKMLSDISQATRYGTRDLSMYAALVGKTRDEFAAMGSSNQITSIFQAINQAGPNAIKILERMGFDGARSLKAIQGMVQSGGLQEAMGIVKDPNSQNGDSLAKASQTAFDGLNDSITKLRNNVTSIVQAFGSQFLPVLGGVAEMAANATQSLAGMLDPLMSRLGIGAGIGTVMTGTMGTMLSNLAPLGLAAGAYSLYRNTAGVGRAAARYQTTGEVPKYAGYRNAMPRFQANDPNLTGWQKGMYALGLGQGRGGLRDGMGGADPTRFQRVMYGVGHGLSYFSPSRMRDTMTNAFSGGMDFMTSRMGGRAQEGLDLMMAQATPEQRKFFDRIRQMRESEMFAPKMPKAPQGARMPRNWGDVFNRAMMVGAAGITGGLGLTTSTISPLTAARINDITSSAADERIWVGQRKVNEGILQGGDKAGVIPAFNAARASIQGFSRGLIDATVGLTKLGASAVNDSIMAKGGYLKAAGRGISSAASGVWNFMRGMGPVGIGMMAYGIGSGIYGDAKQQSDEFTNTLSATDSSRTAYNQYATALGLAAEAAQDFATAITDVTSDVTQTLDQATSWDSSATPLGRKLINTNISGMSANEAISYVASAMQNAEADPRVISALQSDIKQAFGNDRGQSIWSQGMNGEVGFYDFVGGKASSGAINGAMRSLTPWKSRGEFQEGLLTSKEVLGTTLGEINSRGLGDTESLKAVAAFTNSMMAAFNEDAITVADQDRIKKTLAEAIGADPKTANFDALNALYDVGGVNYSSSTGATSQSIAGAWQDRANGQTRNASVAGAWQDRAQASNDARYVPSPLMPESMRRSQPTIDQYMGATKKFLMANTSITEEDWNNLTEGERRSLTYSIGTPEERRNAPDAMRMRETLAGRQHWGLSGSGEALRSSASLEGNENAQISGARLRVNELMSMTGNFADVDAELQKFKATIGNLDDAIALAATAAQEYAQKMQGWNSIGSSPAAGYQYNVARMKSIAAEPETDEQQSRLESQKEQVLADYAAVTSQAQQMVKATRAFLRSQSQAREDFARSRAYSDSERQISLQRQEEAWQKQRARQEEDFNRQVRQSNEDNALSRKRSLEDYNRSREESQYDFNLSRERQEEDFAHQQVLMARQTSKQMSNVYQRMNVQQTWDAQNLVGNLREQANAFTQQVTNLKKLREMGISSETIQLLGLNDPANAQQVARMVSDLQSMPDLVGQFNQASSDRLDLAEMFAFDEDNTSWTEMQRSFDLAAERAQEDFDRMAERGAEAFQRSMDRMANDYGKSMTRMADNYKLTTERAAADYALTLEQNEADYRRSAEKMTDDFNLQMDRSRENFSFQFEQVTGDLSTLQEEALSLLGDSAAGQMEEIFGSFSDLTAALEGEAGDSATRLTDAFQKAYIDPFKGSEFKNFFGGGGYGSPNPNSTWWTDGGKTSSSNPYAGAFGGGGEDTWSSGSSAHGGESTSSMHSPVPAGFPVGTNAAQRYGASRDGGRRKHEGSDFPAPTGTPIFAVLPGIAQTRWSPTGGNVTSIDHGNGLWTNYLHQSSYAIRNGEEVSGGQMIGKVGNTGSASRGSHLHFEVRQGGAWGASKDPVAWLAGAIASGYSPYLSTDGINPGGKPKMSPQNMADWASAVAGIVAPVEAMVAGAFGGGAGAITKGVGAGSITKGAIGSTLGAVNLLGYLGKGAIFDRTSAYGVGERGSEMVLPLDGYGADFLADTLMKYAVRMDERPRGAEHVAAPTTVNYNQDIDASTNFTGPVTVAAQDPNEMARKLEEKARLARLVGSGG